MGKYAEIVIAWAVNRGQMHYELHCGAQSWLFGSPESLERLSTATSFRFVCWSGGFVARRELRGCNPYWYGFKRCGQSVKKVYLGRLERLTIETLEDAAKRLHEDRKGEK